MRTTPTHAATRRRRLIKRGTAVLVGLACTVGTGAAVVASAAVPAFPDNLVVFPDRDFITVEGFAGHAGELATVEVTRNGKVIGSAQGRVSGGDVAFEINHPGGYCWGNGTGLDVTPDIRPGDVATIKFADAVADTTVQDTYVTGVNYSPGSPSFTVVGHVGAGVNPAQMEQRIVNPDLVDTAVAKRDVRAVPGDLAAAPKGGYQSGLTVDTVNHTFTATYVFDDPAVAEIAATGGGDRVMAWQLEDADANRQGLTISEFGELGGPGMGGCPAGPADQAAPTPGTAAAIRSADKTSVQVDWAPATPQPGAADVTGYSIEAIAETASATGERVQLGTRTNATATRTTIKGLGATENYTIEVRALTGAKMGEAFVVQAPATKPAPGGTVPALTADPAPKAGGIVATSSVSLSTGAGANIWYTTDGSPAITAGLPSDKAKLYNGAIAITAQTSIHAVAMDRAGAFSQLEGTYAPPTQVKPQTPTGLTATAGGESAALKWSATDTTITGYGVQVYDAAGKVGALRETTAKSLTVDGLTAGKDYWFTVAAKNGAGYGTESAKVGPARPTDRVTIATARWKAGDFRITGSASVVGATVTVRIGSPTGTVVGSGPVVAAAAPATGGTYDLRFRDAQAQATRPPTIYVVSSRGGQAGPFTVS